MKRRPSFLRWLFRRLLILAVLASAAWGASRYLLPDVSIYKRQNPDRTAFMRLAEERAREEGQPFSLSYTFVPLDRISTYLVHAVLLSEDAGFYGHHGVDFEELKVAVSRDLDAGRFAYGASTLTQQLARNLYLSPSKNPFRKLTEFLITRELEEKLGKRRILELYLNVVEWGDGVYGAEAASRFYFHKAAADLTAEEAVSLAVALPSPRRYAPGMDGKYLSRQRRLVMARMRDKGYVVDPAFSVAASTIPAPVPSHEDPQLGL
jgi:monofunctional biosynthetic peptidoglycan transglycosylase